MNTFSLIHGDALMSLHSLPDSSVNCCVTSPPYYGLRDYGHPDQIGLEKSPQEYVAKLVKVFREVRRVLRNDGTCWINLGDTYAGSRCSPASDSFVGRHIVETDTFQRSKRQGKRWGGGDISVPGLKPKNLVGIPWRVAFALQDDGWYLRSDIIWAKQNPMPESVTDRPTRSHEYIFLLAKSERYYYNYEAIKEPAVCDHPSGNGYKRDSRLTYLDGSGPRGNDEQWKPKGRAGQNAFRGQGHFRDSETGPANRAGRDLTDVGSGHTRNKRDVWTVNTRPYPDAHFATFPPDLIRPCILAGCPIGGIVVDPCCGSGTTGEVALQYGCDFIGIDLNKEYLALSRKRLNSVLPMFAKERTA